MRVVVDTNIAFSAILNSNSQISKILLHPKSGLNFYATDLLLLEIDEHKAKLRDISGLTENDLNQSIHTVLTKVRFINANLIPISVFLEAEQLSANVDIDDTEFIALTNHIHGKLWSGDKALQKGLRKKGWTKFITTSELIELINKKNLKK